MIRNIKMFIVIFTACVLSARPAGAQTGSGAVFAKEVVITTLADGFTWAEGPAEAPDGTVYFTDNRVNKVYTVTPAGEVSVFIDQSRGDNGLAFGPDGSLYSCAMGSKEFVKLNMDGTYTVIVDSYERQPLNSPNDLWFAPDGSIYFTDPFWGREEGRDAVYLLKPGLKTLVKVNGDMFNPNGIIGTPDGKRLYVTNYVQAGTYAFDILSDGTLTNRRLFADQGDDGMAIDTAGNVYLSGETLTVYNPAGEKIDELAFPETPANCIFIGPDKKTLLVTARTSIFTVPALIPGL